MTTAGRDGETLDGDGIPESRLQKLYVEENLTVEEVATRLSRRTGTVLSALRDTEFYEPKTATKLAELDPEDVIDEDPVPTAGRPRRTLPSTGREAGD